MLELKLLVKVRTEIYKYVLPGTYTSYRIIEIFGSLYTRNLYALKFSW